MPSVWCEIALIYAADADAVGAVDKQIRVRGVVGISLPEGAVTGAAGRKQHIHDQGVLVHLRPATVGGGAVRRQVALRGRTRGEPHDSGRLPSDVRDPE